MSASRPSEFRANDDLAFLPKNSGSINRRHRFFLYGFYTANNTRGVYLECVYTQTQTHTHHYSPILLTYVVYDATMVVVILVRRRRRHRRRRRRLSSPRGLRKLLHGLFARYASYFKRGIFLLCEPYIHACVRVIHVW